MNSDDTATEKQRSRGRPLAVTVVVAILATLAGMVVAGTSSAATSRGSGSAASSQGSALATAAPAAVHGVAEDGSEFTGTFKVERFREKQGTVYAVGRLTGELGGRQVNKHVELPVSGATNVDPSEGTAQPPGFRFQLPPTPGACDILTLALGPLDLNLLGLRVALDEVNLLIEAIPGAGNLLGNLLCGVAGLLDPGGLLGGGLGGLLGGLLGGIADFLNGLLAL